jgi:hypothetical protein
VLVSTQRRGLPRLERGLRTFPRRWFRAAFLRFFEVAFRLFARLFGNGSLLRRPQLHPRPPRFGKTDCNRLFRRARAMHPFANQLDFFANKLARLRARRLPIVPSWRARSIGFFSGIILLFNFGAMPLDGCLLPCCLESSAPQPGRTLRLGDANAKYENCHAHFFSERLAQPRRCKLGHRRRGVRWQHRSLRRVASHL